MAPRSGRVTLKDLATDTGLSLSAVSYALRGLDFGLPLVGTGNPPAPSRPQNHHGLKWAPRR